MVAWLSVKQIMTTEHFKWVTSGYKKEKQKRSGQVQENAFLSDEYRVDKLILVFTVLEPFDKPINKMVQC
ncbi:hypothetical protein L596_025821 [Steinernema carpocapsae]|uniref:Uncharacterized protein n=1 Tax=Steinernema carpocapsae TaxID=34508 RepID=A0A4V5ZYY0_STECR|nr:hypothetical protein L596_025821 [Steinernema carpocapsae]